MTMRQPISRLAEPSRNVLLMRCVIVLLMHTLESLSRLAIYYEDRLFCAGNRFSLPCIRVPYCHALF